MPDVFEFAEGRFMILGKMSKIRTALFLTEGKNTTCTRKTNDYIKPHGPAAE